MITKKIIKEISPAVEKLSMFESTSLETCWKEKIQFSVSFILTSFSRHRLKLNHSAHFIGTHFIWKPIKSPSFARDIEFAQHKYFSNRSQDYHFLQVYKPDNRNIISYYLSFSFSKRYEPIPDPVPPAIEWHITKPWKIYDTQNHVFRLGTFIDWNSDKRKPIWTSKLVLPKNSQIYLQGLLAMLTKIFPQNYYL